MYKSNKILAIIPARKGSKRIKNKNLHIFKNKPLIFFTIKETLKSKLIDRAIVSTNDLKIKNLSIKLKADAPFIRPNIFSNNKSSASDVVIHCLNWIENNSNQKFDYVIYLQPTTPNRKVIEIDEALKISINKKINTLISATKCKFPNEWSFKMKKNQNFHSFINKHISKKKSQDYEDFFYLNGSIFIAKISYFKRFKSFHSKSTYIYKTPFENSIDIDVLDDLKLAEKF